MSHSNHIKMLVEEALGSHVHLDALSALEDGSCELILERTK